MKTEHSIKHNKHSLHKEHSKKLAKLICVHLCGFRLFSGPLLWYLWPFLGTENLPQCQLLLIAQKLLLLKTEIFWRHSNPYPIDMCSSIMSKFVVLNNSEYLMSVRRFRIWHRKHFSSVRSSLCYDALLETRHFTQCKSTTAVALNCYYQWSMQFSAIHTMHATNQQQRQIDRARP